MGYPVLDYNGKKQTGFSRLHTVTRNGKRWSTYRAYLKPARGKKNLSLTRNSYVTKVLIDKMSKTAYGVQFTKSGRTFEVRARKEVILSAGALKSPQILMLSGIGPASHLQEMNIEVIKDAPVGENLMDQIGFSGLGFRTNRTKEPVSSGSLGRFDLAVKNYLLNRTGELSSASLECVSYINVDDPDPKNEDPDVELMLAVDVGMRDSEFVKDVRGSQNRTNETHPDHSKYWVWRVPIMNLKPKSRGRLLLRSKNPKDQPKIYPNYFGDTDDLRVLIKGIRIALKLSQTEAFQRYNSTLTTKPSQSCQHLPVGSDEYWECILRYDTFSMAHYSGTCKMGRLDDTTSVVNSRSQVIGIARLRVIDASIIPKLGRYHPNIPVIAIAEKLSDVIKEDWHLL